ESFSTHPGPTLRTTTRACRDLALRDVRVRLAMGVAIRAVLAAEGARVSVAAADPPVAARAGSAPGRDSSTGWLMGSRHLYAAERSAATTRPRVGVRPAARRPAGRAGARAPRGRRSRG